MQDRAFKNPKISFVWDTEVAEVLGDEEVNGLRLSNLKTGEESTLPVQGLFLAIGHKPNTDLFKGGDRYGQGWLYCAERIYHDEHPGRLCRW